jgi:hypothetical protein
MEDNHRKLLNNVSEKLRRAKKEVDIVLNETKNRRHENVGSEECKEIEKS